MKQRTLHQALFLFIVLFIQQDIMYAMKRDGRDNNKRLKATPKKHKSTHTENDVYIDVYTPENNIEKPSQSLKTPNNDPLQNRLAQRVLLERFTIQRDSVQSSSPHNNYPNNSWFLERTDAPLSDNGILTIDNNNYVTYDSCF